MSSASLAAAYLKQRELLARFLRRRTGCEQASQDLLNDIWLRIARSSQTDAPENPEAFLQRVASNLAGDWLRRRRFRATVVGEASDVAEVPEPAPRAEDRLHYREALEFLMKVVEELPPKRKEVFILYRGEGLSVKEVAQRLGIAEKTVEHQVAKALLHCRERLAKEGLWP
ncbi:RNA polymerase sigma factor [Steroidobacter flavus]|uniref:RNA polymerase sigma factor n=1 Tax=Steroidobacter flavus TaxID=1842136 RepID=A0ABV8SNR7_9GAMM